MPNQINRDIYVLSSKVKDPIDYVRLTNDIPIVFTFRDYDILTGSTAQVYVQKPSGKAVYDKATISGNVVTVTVTDQMFAELGVSDLQIRITQGDEKLVSFSQPVRVHPNYTDGDAEQSKNAGGFFDDAEQAVENANAAAESANSAADVANAAAEAVGGAVSGVVNDNQVSEYTTYSSQKLGNFSQLLTTAKNTFVAAINELVLKIGDLKELATTEKTDIVSAINEIEGDKLDKENIANNLTTTRAGYVLDARQGKILDGKIAGKLAKADVVNGLTETAAGKALDARQGKVLNEKIDDTNEAVSELNSKLDGIKVVRKAYPMTLDPNSYVGGNMGQFQIPSEDIQKYGHVISATFSGGSSAPGAVSITHYTGSDEWWAYVSCVDGTGKLAVQFLNVALEFGNVEQAGRMFVNG